MNENNQNELNENKQRKDIDNNEEIIDIIEEIDDELAPKPEYVTREINLDDLYDGAINNTVVIDPITNNEILLTNKKPNYTIIGVIIAVIVLLLLYYVNNKSVLGRTTKDVEPKTTTTKNITEVKENNNGVLTCTYSSKSDAESQNITFEANYVDSKVTDTNFNYVVVSNMDNLSAVVTDLETQYENFFINNASVAGNNISYEKNEKGFTFNVTTDYKKTGFDSLNFTEGQTILYIKPASNDTIEGLKSAYTEKGFSCSLTSKTNEE